MTLLPQAPGHRPRVACEITPQGVVAARSDTAASPLAAVARVTLADGAVTPSLKPDNIADRVEVITAVRRALEQTGAKPGTRTDVTVVIPDSAVRVLLIEFDTLPSKPADALPLVRFRLKKLLPFDADEAMVSYQVMSQSKGLVRALAVAIPRDVLGEYESVVREAGFEPGAVLPATLAALASVDDDGTHLVVNASAAGITTAIVRSGILQLHRSVDLKEPAPAIEILSADIETPQTATDLRAASQSQEIAQAVNVAVAYFEDTLGSFPETLVSAGTLGAEALAGIIGAEAQLRVRELVASEDLLSSAVSASVPRSWLGGVRGALSGGEHHAGGGA